MTNPLSDTAISSRIVILAVLCILLSIIIIIRNHLHVKKVMKSLEHMLDAAIDGTFMEENINESVLSAIEFKLHHYLTASEVSSHNLAVEKDKIKELISDISHQTKTPVSNILLYTELLTEQDSIKENEECQRCLQALIVQTQKLNFLIISLIKMSRLETGILTLCPKSYPIMPMLLKVHEQLALKAAKKALDFIIFPTNVNAAFDEKWTLEAICNIVDNAIKYTSYGSVTIKVTAYELFCRIEISDTGIGIPEEEQTKIFSRFYRSPQVHTKEGIGIGLYLAREIITSENGYIKLISKPGCGSTFFVYLPLEAKNN